MAIETALKRSLDDLLSAEHGDRDLLHEVSMLCEQDPNSVWDLLALIDQYHRRGTLSQPLFASMKSTLEQAAMGHRPDRAARTEVTQALPPPARRFPTPIIDSAAPAPIDDVALKTGRVLRNRYVIEALLGTGGMGTVFKALDRYRDDLPAEDRYVAVKVLHDRVTKSPQMLAELQREFHFTQALSHPNVVKVYELDRDQGLTFFTMELLQGRLLSHLVVDRKSTRFPQRRALAIIRDVGAALVHAHSRGVVHGDLKAHNIMITESGEVRVLDFGASNALRREPWIADPEHDLQVRSGTPGYASCEQLEGQLADPRDDVYALACLAYELFTGHHPFRRRPAIEARSLEMRARRPADLTHKQWQSLSKGLAWTREQRSFDFRQWLVDLGCQQGEERLPPLGVLQAREPPARAAYGGWGWGIAAVLVLGFAAVAWFYPRQAQLGFDEARRVLLDAQTQVVAQIRRLAASQVSAAASAPTHQPMVAVPLPAPARLAAEPAAAPAAVSLPVSETPNARGLPPNPIIAAPGTISLAQDTIEVAPGAGAARILVHRSGGTRGEVTFVWWTEPGSAKAESDFVSFGRKVEHIVDGEDSATFFVPIVSDSSRKHTEEFYVNVGEPGGGAAMGATVRAAVVILPDE